MWNTGLCSAGISTNMAASCSLVCNNFLLILSFPHFYLGEFCFPKGEQPQISILIVVHTKAHGGLAVYIYQPYRSLCDYFHVVYAVPGSSQGHFQLYVIGEGLAALLVHPEPRTENQSVHLRLHIDIIALSHLLVGLKYCSGLVCPVGMYLQMDIAAFRHLLH